MGRLERVGGGITALLGLFESAMIYVDAVDREVRARWISCSKESVVVVVVVASQPASQRESSLSMSANTSEVCPIRR